MICTAHGVEGCARKKCARERNRRPWWTAGGGEIVYDDDRPREGD